MIKEILENFNSYHSRLKFTHEIEFENTLSFLNLLMIRKEDGIIETNWHRKNTFSHGKKFGRNAALPLVLLRHYTGGQLQRSS